MPFYDYTCGPCGTVFESLQTIATRNEPTFHPCPECGQEGVTKNPSVLAVCDSVRIGRSRPDNGFKEVQSRIAQHHPHHTMNMR